jgi:RimJ/RimL family protein N-acetyltransferase
VELKKRVPKARLSLRGTKQAGTPKKNTFYFMNLILETKNLFLKPLDRSHAEDFFAMDRNPNVHKYLWQKPVENIEETVATIDVVLEQYVKNDIGRFAIHLKENNAFVGWCGLKFNTETVNNKTNFYDIGYRIAERYWGKGYGTESALAWMNYGFEHLKLQKIEAAAHVENVASNRILEKIGLKFTETYLEENVRWNWYEVDATAYKNQNL